MAKRAYTQKEVQALLKMAHIIKADGEIPATDKFLNELGKLKHTFPLYREPGTGKMFFAWRSCSYMFKDYINDALDSLRME